MESAAATPRPTEAITVHPRVLVRRDGSLEDEDTSTNTIRSVTPNPFGYAGIQADGNAQKDATTPVVAAPIPASEVPSSVPSRKFKRKDHRSSSCRDVSGERFRARKPSRKNVGIVIGDFEGLFADELSLTMGERIEILSKDTKISRNIGWWTGRDNKGKEGIFPAACVKVVTSSVDVADLNIETEFPVEIPPNEISLREVIGVGGFGKVHRADYKGHIVAVKVAKFTTYDSLKAVQEVISEAEKFARLAHPNVCALVGVVLVKDVCLVMEYAQGGSLSDALHKRGVSLPIDVIMDWATQIASGMDYLHNETQPSLIHRDLKSSNILLSNRIDPSNLNTNVIKITDFGLAREIDHTTHMSGAGTYPYMAPEVICSSDFSKKSDVWSYAVVLWELLTGERPYGSFNLYRVAFGVGQGTLSLPIPDGCPDTLEILLTDCWRRNHPDRPTFTEILSRLTEAKEESFFSSTSHEVFRSIQSSWKEEIHRRFVDLKKIETEFAKREEDFKNRMQLEDEKMRQREEALVKAQEDILKQQEILDKAQQQLQVLQAQDRPPRTNRFKPWRIIRQWLPSSGDSRHLVNRVGEGNILPNRVSPKRMSSVPNPTEHHHRHSHPKKASLPIYYGGSVRLHRPASSEGDEPEAIRRRSADLPPGVSKDQLNIITSTTGQFHTRRRGSTPSPTSSATSAHTPSLTLGANQLKPSASPSGVRKVVEQSVLNRSRSSSDPRSPSPQHLPSHVSPPRSPNAKQASSGSHAVSQSAVVAMANHSRLAQKPVKLALGPKTRSSLDNSPNSPMMTVTSADGHMIQYDSGKDSFSCSDTSNSSQQLIKLDSPPAADPNRTFALFSEFDPLRLQQASRSNPMQPSFSNDSLLCDASRGKTSGSSSPALMSTSPQPPASPWPSKPVPMSSRRCAVTDTSIVRPRPKGLSIQTSEIPLPTSAPSSRPHSPKAGSLERDRVRLGNSPTGSIHSLIQYPTNYDSDYAIGMYHGFQSDSDATSTTSSIMDLTDLPDPTPPILPTALDHRDLDDIDVEKTLYGQF